MLNSRSIPAEAWASAREALIRFFASRHAHEQAEDLANTTLARVWEREDYEFARVEDFPKVCLGFARMLLLETQRATRNAPAALDFDAPAPSHASDSHRAVEARMMLEEVCRIGATRLKEADWKLIRDALPGQSAPSPPRTLREANRNRVGLHRARRRLAEFVGIRKKDPDEGNGR